MESILDKYGWLGFALYFFFKDIVPFGMTKFFPERVKAAQAERAQNAVLLKNQIDREQNEDAHRRKHDERIASAMEQMAAAIVINNERLSQVIGLTTNLSAFTSEAVSDMREKVARIHKETTKEKIKPVRGAKKQ